MPDFRYKIRRWSFVIMLISLSLSFSSFGRFRLAVNPGNISLTNKLPGSNQDNKFIADSSKRIQVDKKITGMPEGNSAVKPVQKNNQLNNSGKVYKIIAGSFASHENAILRARQYFSKGYKSEIVVRTGKDGARVELVSIRSFEDISEAKSFLKKFQRDIDASAWLYSND
jgi:hypothetical protein